MKRRVRALLSRTVSLVLGWLASRSLRTALFVSDTFAMFRALSAWPVSRRMWTNHVRTQLMDGWVRREGPAPFRRLIRPNDTLAQLRPPTIIGTFHIGPVYALGALVERLKGETFVLRGSIGSTDQQRAAAFHRAIECLRAGGFVVVAFDMTEVQQIAVPFRGRTLRLSRGPFSMARIANAPIVPVVARWVGDEVELIVADALPAGDEQAMAEAAGRWLEGYLREWPGEMSYRIRELMSE
ncbi:MAG: hypothetical protein ACJ74H_14235 [Thermoanaerobaculia bacterium]